MRAKKAITRAEAEECLYCHGNFNSMGPCPMCGDPRLMSTNVKTLGQIAFPKLDFSSGVLMSSAIAGV
jgi:hypothetical protein